MFGCSEICFLNFPLHEGHRAHERLFDKSNVVAVVGRESLSSLDKFRCDRVPTGADWIRFFFGKLDSTRFKKLDKTKIINELKWKQIFN